MPIYGYNGVNGGQGTNPSAGGGGAGGGGGRGDPQPAGASPTGFGGLSSAMGLSSNYQAHAASADYGGKGYGQGGYLSGQMGNQAGDLARQQTTNGSFAGPNTALNDPRIAADYARAAPHAGQDNLFLGNTLAESTSRALQQQGLDRSIAAQMAAAKSGNQMQGGLAQYQAAQQGAGMQQAAVQNSILNANQMAVHNMQLQQQQDLQNRQMDLGLLGQSQNMGQFNANYGLEAGRMNQGLYQGLLGLQQGYSAQDLQGQMGYAQLASNNYNQAQGINAGVASQQAAGGQQLFNGAVGAAAGVATGGASLAAAGAAGGAGGGLAGGGVPLNTGANLGGPGGQVYDISNDAANMSGR